MCVRVAICIAVRVFAFIFTGALLSVHVFALCVNPRVCMHVAVCIVVRVFVFISTGALLSVHVFALCVHTRVCLVLALLLHNTISFCGLFFLRCPLERQNLC